MKLSKFFVIVLLSDICGNCNGFNPMGIYLEVGFDLNLQSEYEEYKGEICWSNGNAKTL